MTEARPRAAAFLHAFGLERGEPFSVRNLMIERRLSPRHAPRRCRLPNVPPADMRDAFPILWMCHAPGPELPVAIWVRSSVTASGTFATTHVPTEIHHGH